MAFQKALSIAELDNTCIYIYDPFEKDVDKKIIAICDNHKKASNALGVHSAVVHKSCASWSRFFSPILNKTVTCRLKSKNQKNHLSNKI